MSIDVNKSDSLHLFLEARADTDDAQLNTITSRHDDISLVSIREFYKHAPSHLSKPIVTKSNKHKQTLSRLGWELEQRKRLSGKLELLQKTRDDVVEEIGLKKQKLQTLSPHLQALLKSSFPLQESFNLPLDYIRKQHELANLLPRPLYALFLQAKAYQEACDKLLAVTIEGDSSVAQVLLHRTMKEDKKFCLSAEGGEDSDSDLEEKDYQDSRRGLKSRRSNEQKMESDSPVLYDVLHCHPLSVILNLDVEQNGPTLQLKFFYFTTLNFVTVKTCKLSGYTSGDPLPSSPLLSGDNLLQCLLPSDYGLTCPNPSAVYLLEKSSLQIEESVFEFGRPYIWAQKLCGLEFLLNIEDDQKQRSFCKMEHAICKLRKRVLSRIKLAKQLKNFSENKVSCADKIMMLLPKKIQSSLAEWKNLSFSEYRNLPHTHAITDLGLLGSEKEAENHLYFLAVIKRGTTAKLKAAIALKKNYPETIPLITLALKWRGTKYSGNDQNIREMEAEVNVKWSPIVKELSDEILAAQLLRLMAMLDIYVETECENCHLNQPGEFSLNRTCPRFTKGPARLKPLWFQKSNKTHVHHWLC
ncbi:unnamed protein product [Clavelina lepadiformis]|uniref:THO complex subunit 5 n=1 Tax=Clavelina lepadiformis TaxID=159417 RepID=A0ABP0F2U0_CLALP